MVRDRAEDWRRNKKSAVRIDRTSAEDIHSQLSEANTTRERTAV